MQAKRVSTSFASIGAVATRAAQIAVPAEPREMVNFHNMWMGISVVPLDTDANSEGTWVLAILNSTQVFSGFTTAELDAELRNQQIIACGQWAASNQSPFHMSEQVKTSRNLNPGDVLELVVTQENITAGFARVALILCAHTTRK